MKEIVIKTRNLTKKYKDSIVLNNVNLDIKRGEIYGLVGKNGAGKTTLIRMLSGLSFPTNGEIELFNGFGENGLNKARRRIGVIIETPCFFPYLSARKNLEYYKIQRGIDDEEVVKNTLKFIGLEDTGNKKFKNFSLGMKQRLGLGLAIMSNPDLLILDEPINGLDPAGIVEIREILLRLNKEKNVTIIISSHILSELEQLTTQYGFINKGELIEQISAKKLEEKLKSCIVIKVDNVEKATAIIENQLGCKDYEVLNDKNIRLMQLVDKPEMVAQALVMSGIKLYSLNQNGLNLEDYFMNLIGGNKNA